MCGLRRGGRIDGMGGFCWAVHVLVGSIPVMLLRLTPQTTSWIDQMAAEQAHLAFGTLREVRHGVKVRAKGGGHCSTAHCTCKAAHQSPQSLTQMAGFRSIHAELVRRWRPSATGNRPPGSSRSSLLEHLYMHTYLSYITFLCVCTCMNMYERKTLRWTTEKGNSLPHPPLEKATGLQAHHLSVSQYYVLDRVETCRACANPPNLSQKPRNKRKAEAWAWAPALWIGRGCANVPVGLRTHNHCAAG